MKGEAGVSQVWLQVSLSLATSVVGGLITGGFFYLRGGKQLGKEAKELKELNLFLIRGLETAGLVEVNRDSAGRPIGYVLKGKGDFVAAMPSFSANVAPEKKEPI
jgi:hypothetical protein